MMIVFGILIILLSLSLISYLIYYYWKNNKSKNRVNYYNKRQNYYSQANSNQNSESYLIDNFVDDYNYFYGINDNHKHIDNNGLNNTNNKTRHSDIYLETITNNCESTNSSSFDSSSSSGD